MRRALIVASLLAAAALIVIGFVYLFQRQFVYFPNGEVGATPSGAEDVSFTTADGLVLDGWFFPAEAEGAPAAVVFNGNGGNRAGRTELARELGDLGLAVLLFDYRGYGGNPGQPTEEGLTDDGTSAVEYVISRPDVEADSLVYFGESLGTGVAVATALQREPTLLILRSPYTSLPDVAATTVFRPFAALLWDEFPSLERIPHIEAPLLVVAGSLDRTIPIDMSRSIHEAANDPKLVHEVASDHNDYALASGFLSDPSVRAFISSAISDPES